MKNYNWFMFVFVMVLAMVGALANEGVTNIYEWLAVCVFVLPFAIVFGYMCSEPKKGNHLNGYEKQKCSHCGLNRTQEGYDGCIGELKGVANACCGHGEDNAAYVQFFHKNYEYKPNDIRLEGKEAIKYIKLKRQEDNTKEK